MSDDATDGVRIGLLGPIEATVAGNVRSIPGLRRKAVLAILALQEGTVVSVDHLIDVVWNGNSPATAVNTLQSHISYLRREFDLRDAIVVRPPGYVLDLGAESTDLQVAERLIRQGMQADDPEPSATRLRAALALLRGPSLADVRDLAWLDEQAERVERVRRGAVQALMHARLALGEHASLVADLENLTEQYPFDEDLHRQLMLALYRTGRQTDALATYRRLRHRLAEELGVDPSPLLRDLEAAVLRQDAFLNAPSVTGRVMATPPGRLVERAKETGLVHDALGRALTERSGSVVVFEGPAGIGKTSLLDHARATAEANGFTVAAARGIDLEQDYAWGCVGQLFERHIAAASTDGPRPTGWEPSGGVEPRGEYQIIHSLFWFVCDLAARTPLLIVADDLHWSDVPSARFLAYLAARLDGLPVVVVAALRPGSTRVEHIASAMARATGSVTCGLPPLSIDGAAGLLTGIIDAAPDPGLLLRCHDLTNGNPFLLKELGCGSIC